MTKLHIKKGDTVYVNAGDDKGTVARVLEVLVKEQRAIVEGVNMVSKHTKPNAKNPQVLHDERVWMDKENPDFGKGPKN